MNSPKPSILRIFWGKSPKRSLLRLAVLIPLASFVFSQILIPARPKGISMAPTYPDGGFRFINCFAFRKSDPRRGDVVAIRMAGKKSYYLKRVLATPGERIAFRQGQLFINGNRQEEPYLQFTGQWNMPPLFLEQHEYFVGGDNRRVPIDQHVLGVVQREDMIGGLLF